MIHWPPAFAPELADLHAHDELVTDVAPEAIWPWLLRAGLLHFHQRWLEGLVHAARLGHPDHVPSLRRINR